MTGQQELIESLARRVLLQVAAEDLHAARHLIEKVPYPRTLALAIARVAVDHSDGEDEPGRDGR